jgi:hypothetical protein
VTNKQDHSPGAPPAPGFFVYSACLLDYGELGMMLRVKKAASSGKEPISDLPLEIRPDLLKSVEKAVFNPS